MLALRRHFVLASLLVATVSAAEAADSHRNGNAGATVVGARHAQCTLFAAERLGISLHCKDGPVQAAFNQDAVMLLTRYPTAPFNSSGVDLTPSCFTPGCLLTICGSTDVIIQGAVRKLEPMPGFVQSVLCVANNSRVTLRRAVIADNQHMRGVHVMHDAHVMLDSTSIAGNSLLDSDGAGVRVTDRAEVMISGGSDLAGNLVPGGNGAGVFAGGDAVVNIVDSSIVNNTCDMFGGGAAAFGNARVSISGSSMISGNVARNGGGVAVLGNATLHVSEGVILTGNAITAKGAPDLHVGSTQPVHIPLREWGKKSVQAVATQG
jgi:hypothetical protein